MGPFAHLVFDGLLVEWLCGVPHYARLLLVPQTLTILDVALDIGIRRRLAVGVHNIPCAN